MDMTKRLLGHNFIHKMIGKAISEQNEIGWGNVLRGRFSKEWGKFQDIVDKSEKRRPRPGIMVNLICILWEEMINRRKTRNIVQHRTTKEERRNRANEKIFPLAWSAYRTRHLHISLYNISLFILPLEERLKIEPGENQRWLEIVNTAKYHKRARGEAVLLAARKITSYFYPGIEQVTKTYHTR